MAGIGLHSFVASITSSLVSSATSEFATRTGVGSLGHKRLISIEQNRALANMIPTAAELIERFWQRPFSNGQPTPASRQWLGRALLDHGISNGDQTWNSIIEFSNSVAPMRDFLAAYFRGLTYMGGGRIVGADGIDSVLERRLQRDMLQDRVTRELLLRPPWHFSASDAFRLTRSGLVSAEEGVGLLSAAGAVRVEDRDLLLKLVSHLGVNDVLRLYWRGEINEADARGRMALAGVVDPGIQVDLLRLAWNTGSPGLIAEAMTRRSWDEAYATKWQLDEGLNESPAGRYWLNAHGLNGATGALPGANGNPADWAKLEWRATRRLPTIAEAVTMQRRLRPRGDGTGLSVLDQFPEWTADDTRETLKRHGFTAPFVDHLMSLVHEPIQQRVINWVLVQALKHNEVAQAATNAFGQGVDWVEYAFLDQGHRPQIAKLISAAIRSRADDTVNAERDQNQKAQRTEARRQAIREYRTGMIDRNNARALMQDAYFTGAMADKEIDLIDRDFGAALVEEQIKAIKKAFLSGKVSAPEAQAQLAGIGIQGNRQQQYIYLWVWERTEDVRMLNTSEVLSMLRKGLVTPAEAQSRLTNMGWVNSDALLEVAMVEREMVLADARAKAIAVTKATMEARRIATEKKRALTAAEKQAEKNAKAAHKLTLQTATAIHRKLMNQSSYYRDVHNSNSAYANAEKVGDDEKMQAELQRQIAAYNKWLIQQIELAGQAPEVANIVAPIETKPADGPVESEGAGDTEGEADSSGGGLGGTDSGGRPEAGAGAAVP